jgi:signal transduction histidine kinase
MSNDIDSQSDKEFEENPLDEELGLIARDIVEALGYTGAMVAAYEKGDALPVRAIYTNPSIASIDKIREWEKQVQKISPKKYHNVSITDPAVARVYLHQEQYKNNLSVKAAEKGEPVVSEELFDLFVPIIPDMGVVRQLVRLIQSGLKIKQVIAVPFFIDSEYVGNLFAAHDKEFSATDVRILSAFAHRAASSIRSERRRLQGESNQNLILDMQRDISSDEKILNRIVQGVVEDLGYVGAMVATYEEQGDALPVRAAYVDPSIASMDDIRNWERQIQNITPPGIKVSITDPAIARVYLHREEYKNNLGVKAAEKGIPITSNDIFDLFTPIVPDNFVVRQVVKIIQSALKIKQVITVPFFIDGEYLGNLFAATQSGKFSYWEIDLLQTFGQNAAAGLRNAKLYRQAEERRKAAEIFGKMAFSASASVHALQNHLGVIKGNLQLAPLLGQMDEDTKLNFLNHQIPRTLERIEEMRKLVEGLHEPWQPIGDTSVSIYPCIVRAIEKVFPAKGETLFVQTDFSGENPSIKTSPEMLTEAFKVLIKNAREATSDNERKILINSRCDKERVYISIQDNGSGIPMEKLSEIFEMRYSTKGGLGFGLFWVRDYIEGLHGKINVKSEVNKGTMFEIQLPL